MATAAAYQPTAYDFCLEMLPFCGSKGRKKERKQYFRQLGTHLNCIKDEILIDPCMGSGHILVYAFDVLMQIYGSQGYTQRDAAQSILQNNLYGLDIDERAAQLACFAVMMKARQYDRRIFNRGIQPHVYAIVESNGLSGSWTKDNQEMQRLFDAMRDAKEYGSILTVPILDFDGLHQYAQNKVADIDQFDMESNKLQEQLPQVLALIDMAEMMARKYQVVVTNPPYMGAGNMNPKLSDFVKKYFLDSKNDMSTVFMEKTMKMCTENGYMAMINIPVWMFISSYEKLRCNLLQHNTLLNMVHPGRGIFGSDFGTTIFVFRKGLVYGYQGSYRRLFDQQGEVKSQEEREQAMLARKGCYTAQQSNFARIPGLPVAYWVSEKFIKAFEEGTRLGSNFRVSEGIKTGNNDKFLRFWTEVDSTTFSFANESEGKNGIRITKVEIIVDGTETCGGLLIGKTME